MKIILVIYILTAIYPALFYAQENEINVRGVVLDIVSHLPLANAAVQIPQLQQFTVSDSNGIFEFRGIPDGRYLLQISYLGYKRYSTEINIKGKTAVGLIIHLQPVPLQTSTIVVTGEHPNSRFDDLYELSSVLKGKDLDRDLGTTLASTLKNETGLAIRSMGPAPARPVIRGLGSDRVSISEDGFKTNDLSAASPDHAVTVEPFTIERIEVLRGPRVLLQNSTTIGGVVNIIRGEIPSALPPSFTGSAGIYAESVNKGYLGAATGELPFSDFVLRGEISRRKASDLSTPSGKLRNSEIINLNYSSGLSYIRDWGFAGISFREFETDYGIPGGFIGAHPNGININMYKRDLNSRILFNVKNSAVRNIELFLSRNYYHHTEFERSDLIGAEFAIYNYEGKLNFNTSALGPFDFGTIGISAEYRDFNIGGFVFTPPTQSFRYSGYFFQTLSFEKLSFELAARYNYDLMKPDETGRARNGTVNRNFNTYSLAVSGMYEFTNGFFTGATISRSSRVPTIEELYSEGPHLAAYSYDIGNPSLKDERGTGAEIFFYNKADKYFFNLTLFLNDLPYYIISRNTGIINFNTLLPVYQTSGVGAYFHGIETQIDYRLSNLFTISASLTYTLGEIKETKEALPSIPPLKGLMELKYNLFSRLLTGIVIDAASRQGRTDFFEEPTAGYIIPGLFLQYSFFPVKEIISNLSLSLENIFNKEYRNHLSRVKSIMPEPGRNFKLTLRTFF